MPMARMCRCGDCCTAVAFCSQLADPKSTAGLGRRPQRSGLTSCSWFSESLVPNTGSATHPFHRATCADHEDHHWRLRSVIAAQAPRSLHLCLTAESKATRDAREETEKWTLWDILCSKNCWQMEALASMSWTSFCVGLHSGSYWYYRSNLTGKAMDIAILEASPKPVSLDLMVRW